MVVYNAVMTFHDFASYLEELESISSRLSMTEKLAGVLAQLAEPEIPAALYMMQGRLVPLYQSLEFNLSTKMVLRGLARLYEHISHDPSEHTNLFGESDGSQAEAAVTRRYKSLGDLGLVAAELLAESKPTSSIELVTVFEALVEIAKEEGSGSQERKLSKLLELLHQLDAVSAKVVVRIIIGKLRLGFSNMTIIDALSWVATGDKSERDLLEEAFNKQADLGSLAQRYLALKSDQLARQRMLQEYLVEVTVPVIPALCQRLNSAQEIIEKMEQVIAEPKYDGMRVQIHITSDNIKVYTRNLEDVSHMFPELNGIQSQLNELPVILDAEAIGFDPHTQELVEFQQTITRRRKHEVAEKAVAVPIRFYLFDLLLAGKESLVDKKLRERKDRLKNLFNDNEVIVHTPYIVTSDPIELRKFHNQQLAEGLEGAVIKQVDSMYRSGRKGWSWVKIKEAEGTTGKLTDTLDCVVMGYYVGRGKRTQFGLGAFLVGVYDPSAGQIKTIAKIGTGMSDEQLRELKERGDSLQTTEKPKLYEVPTELKPDTWLDPSLVVEIAADELTRSPLHSAGKALRFPRLVRFRDDKSWQEATTITELDKIQVA